MSGSVLPHAWCIVVEPSVDLRTAAEVWNPMISRLLGLRVRWHLEGGGVRYGKLQDLNKWFVEEGFWSEQRETKNVVWLEVYRWLSLQVYSRDRRKYANNQYMLISREKPNYIGRRVGGIAQELRVLVGLGLDSHWRSSQGFPNKLWM